MKQFWKRNLVVMTVLVFVCVAVYLNWRYADTGLTPTSTEEEEVQQTAGETQQESADAYFATARLTRQQARDNALSLLQEAAAEEQADQETLDQVAQSIQVLAGYTLTEAQIENLVTAKGYADCVAFMSEDSISVVVDCGDQELSSSDVAKIMDIVKGETTFTAEQITIMEAN